MQHCVQHLLWSITFCDEACKASGRFCSWEAQPDLLAQRGAHSPCLANELMVFDAVWMQEADPKAKRNRLVLSIFHHFFALWLIADSWRYCCDLPTCLFFLKKKLSLITTMRGTGSTIHDDFRQLPRKLQEQVARELGCDYWWFMICARFLMMICIT